MWEYNRSDAFRSVQNLHDNMHWRFNESDYPSIQNMTQTPMSAENTTMAENSVKAFFTPITDYWAAPEVLGSWFYVIVLFFVVGSVYVKTKRIETTALSMLFMAMIVAAPATVGTWIIPADVLDILYICIVLAIMGLLYRVITAGGR